MAMADKISKTKKVVKLILILIRVAFSLAIFFIPAGTLNWPEAWIFIGIFLLYTVAAVKDKNIEFCRSDEKK